MITDDNTSTEAPRETSDTSTSGTAGAADEVAVVRSEERMRIQTQSQPWACARLRRYVVTETQTITVPVRREYVVLETARYTDAGSPGHLDETRSTEDQSDAWVGRSDAAGDENPVLINEEVAEVVTTIRPVARVGIAVERRTEQRTITVELALEHVTVDGDVLDRRS